MKNKIKNTLKIILSLIIFILISFNVKAHPGLMNISPDILFKSSIYKSEMKAKAISDKLSKKMILILQVVDKKVDSKLNNKPLEKQFELIKKYKEKIGEYSDLICESKGKESTKCKISEYLYFKLKGKYYLVKLKFFYKEQKKEIIKKLTENENFKKENISLVKPESIKIESYGSIYFLRYLNQDNKNVSTYKLKFDNGTVFLKKLENNFFKNQKKSIDKIKNKGLIYKNIENVTITDYFKKRINNYGCELKLYKLKDFSKEKEYYKADLKCRDKNIVMFLDNKFPIYYNNNKEKVEMYTGENFFGLYKNGKRLDKSKLTTLIYEFSFLEIQGDIKLILESIEKKKKEEQEKIEKEKIESIKKLGNVEKFDYIINNCNSSDEKKDECLKKIFAKKNAYLDKDDITNFLKNVSLEKEDIKICDFSSSNYMNQYPSDCYKEYLLKSSKLGEIYK